MMTLKHRATNRMNNIQIGQRWVDNHDEICQEPSNFFSKLLSVDDPLDSSAQIEIL